MNGVDVKGLVVHMLRRPKVVPLVIRAGWPLRARHWWRRPPFLPLPGKRYWVFRIVTATGSPEGLASTREVVDAAIWSSRQPRGR